MSSPLVSVVVPVYNHADYIIDALDSILEQNYRPVELLLVDDGSTDNSVPAASQWIKTNLSAFTRCELVRQSNSGVARTLNRLISLAKGQYILPIASDDMLVADGISKRVEYLESNPDKLAVIGDCFVIDGTGQQTYTSGLFEYGSLSRRELLNPKYISRELAIKWELPGPVLLARASTYESTRIGLYDESLSLEDRGFYLKLMAQDSLGFIDEPVARYRVHGLNTSQKSSSDSALRTRHLQDTVQIENSLRCQFFGLAKLGITLRSRIARQRHRNLTSASAIGKFRLGGWLLALGVTYYLHRLHAWIFGRR